MINPATLFKAAKSAKYIVKTFSGKDFRSLPKISIPEKATQFKVVEIESISNKDLSKVYSFYDDNNNLLEKVVNKKQEDGKIVEVIRNYKREQEILSTNTIYSLDGKITSGARESFFVQPLQSDAPKSVSRMKFKYEQNLDGSRSETQIYENLAPKDVSVDDKKLITTATRLKDGNIVNTNIEGNSELVDKVKQDPYLFMRNYDTTDFIESASIRAQNSQNVSGIKGGLEIKKIDGTDGRYNPLTKNVIINPEQNKSELIDTLNHEYKHKWQFELMSKYKESFLNFLRKKDNKIILSSNEKKLARKLLFANETYCSAKKNLKRYDANFLEINANEAGENARKEFNEYSKKLAELLDVPKEMTEYSTKNSLNKDLFHNVKVYQCLS